MNEPDGLHSEVDNLDAFASAVVDVLHHDCGYTNVTKLNNVSGGLINRAALYDSSNGKLFVKFAGRDNTKAMFQSEMESLKTIQRTQCIRVPTPLQIAEIREPRGALFVMEYLENLRPMDKRWSELGTKMARLHKYNADMLEKKRKRESFIGDADAVLPVEKFGFSCPAFHGPKFVIPPEWSDNWLEYFARFLLEPQFSNIEQEVGDRMISSLWTELQLLLDVPFRNLTISPAITHGDFCSINIGETDHEAVIYDPSCTYAHWEFDWTQVTGWEKFPDEFYHSYQAILPFPANFNLRQTLYHAYAYALMFNVNSEHGNEMKGKLIDSIQECISGAKHLLK